VDAGLAQLGLDVHEVIGEGRQPFIALGEVGLKNFSQLARIGEILAGLLPLIGDAQVFGAQLVHLRSLVVMHGNQGNRQGDTYYCENDGAKFHKILCRFTFTFFPKSFPPLQRNTAPVCLPRPLTREAVHPLLAAWNRVLLFLASAAPVIVISMPPAPQSSFARI